MKKSKTPERNNLDKLYENVGKLVFANVETAKSMRAATKQYNHLYNPEHFNEHYRLKQFLKETFSNLETYSKPSNEKFITHKLQLIPSAKSKLPTLDIIARRYHTGATILEIKKGNDPIFTNMNPSNIKTINYLLIGKF